MRLIDLEPRWYTGMNGVERAGITFRCPHCPETGYRLAVAVKDDGSNMDPEPENPKGCGAGKYVWAMTGDSFENLTLSPSVDAGKAGHWHGHITNGQIVGGI